MVTLFLAVFSLSFIATLAATALLIRKLKFLKEKKPASSEVFFGRDMAKPANVYVPTMGGIAITFGFTFAVLFSLRFVSNPSAITLLASLVTTLIIAIIGFLDDIFIVRRIWRMVLPGIAALPLIIVDSGSPVIKIFGYNLELGGFYTYFMIPLGVIACANLINILAGFNGLEAGCGAISSISIFIASLLLMALEPHKYSAAPAIIMVAIVGASLAFITFNWHPAKIFPGNVGTYVIGAAIACAVITGDMEKIGIIALTPQIVEFLLKAKEGFRIGNFGEVADGRLVYKNRVSSLTHILMKYAALDERTLVIYLLGIQAFFGLMAVWSIFWYR